MIKKGLVDGAQDHLKFIIDHIVNEDEKLPIEDFVIFSLYNSIINKVYDIKFLLDNNQHDSIEIIIRTVFEQYVYLKYILLSNTKVKSEQFYYSYKIQSALKGKNIFINFKNNTNLYGKLPELDEESKKQLGKSIPSEEDFIDQKEKFLKKFKSNLNYEPKKNSKRYYENWYNIDGDIHNFKELINIKGIEIYTSLYDIIYGYGSMSVHGIDVPGNLIKLEEISILGKEISESQYKIFVGVILIDLSKKVTNYYNLNKNHKNQSKLKKMELSYKLG